MHLTTEEVQTMFKNTWKYISKEGEALEAAMKTGSLDKARKSIRGMKDGIEFMTLMFMPISTAQEVTRRYTPDGIPIVGK